MAGFAKNIPCEIQEYEVYHPASSDDLVKLASSNVDLPDNFVYDPDYLYLWVRIVSAGEFYGPNKNGDYFPEEELIQYYESFRTAHVFKNHENKNVEHAIGEIITARWNPMMKCVEVFKSIDRKRAPEIARGFVKGYLTDVSMGCKVPYTICSICGNKARRKSEFCVHVNRYRMQYLGNGERVFEINYEPNFHDSSAVLNGAERVAKATFVIDTPPAGVKVAFQKVAGVSGKDRYVKVGAQMEKAASHHAVHPLLVNEKLAHNQVGLLQKLAELEKELTGKIMNVITTPTDDEQDTAGRVLDVVRFLTEKRLDSESLARLAATLQALAKEQGVSEQKVISVFLGLAEIMGIRLYPTELHELLSHMTDAHLSDAFTLTERNQSEVYPKEYVDGAAEVLEATKQLPEISDAGPLLNLYNDAPHELPAFERSPLSFIRKLVGPTDVESSAPIKVVRVIRQTLSPMMATRGGGTEALLARLAPYLLGTHPVIGHADAARDVAMITDPRSLGDLLGTLSYRMYQDMRPTIVRTKMIRLAMQDDRELEKVANEIAPHPGIGRGKLFFWGVPAVFGLSALQRNRREHGKNLSDVENFVADHPVVTSAATMFWGKPASAAAINLARKAKAGFGNFKQKVINKLDGVPDPMVQTASTDDVGMIKTAQALEVNSYRVFHPDMLSKMATEYDLSAEQVAVLKTACLFDVGGMNKHAEQLLTYYGLPLYSKDLMLKHAVHAAKAELEKAADDFTKNLVMDGIMTPSNIPTTLPGRFLDAFLVTKLMKMTKPPTPQAPANANVNQGGM